MWKVTRWQPPTFAFCLCLEVSHVRHVAADCALESGGFGGLGGTMGHLIFFLTYTPLNIDHVRGVQGRYFVIALPMAAIFLASMTNIDLPRNVLATTAITGSLLSGITSFQALLGAHWSVP
jgi:hypothetical protein